jgi:hypothetical protein
MIVERAVESPRSRYICLPLAGRWNQKRLKMVRRRRRKTAKMALYAIAILLGSAVALLALDIGSNWSEIASLIGQVLVRDTVIGPVAEGLKDIKGLFFFPSFGEKKIDSAGESAHLDSKAESLEAGALDFSEFVPSSRDPVLDRASYEAPSQADYIGGVTWEGRGMGILDTGEETLKKSPVVMDEVGLPVENIEFELWRVPYPGWTTTGLVSAENSLNSTPALDFSGRLAATWERSGFGPSPLNSFDIRYHDEQSLERIDEDAPWYYYDPFLYEGFGFPKEGNNVSSEKEGITEADEEVSSVPTDSHTPDIGINALQVLLGYDINVNTKSSDAYEQP